MQSILHHFSSDDTINPLIHFIVIAHLNSDSSLHFGLPLHSLYHLQTNMNAAATLIHLTNLLSAFHRYVPIVPLAQRMHPEMLKTI